MSFSNRMARDVINHIFNKAAFTALTTVYVDLSTADPLEDLSANAPPTPGTGGYAAIAIPTANMTVTEGDPSYIENDNDELFPESTAAWSTGATPITHATLWRHATTRTVDTYIGGAVLPVSRVVNASGITLKISTGDLSVSLD